MTGGLNAITINRTCWIFSRYVYSWLVTTTTKKCFFCYQFIPKKFLPLELLITFCTMTEISQYKLVESTKFFQSKRQRLKFISVYKWLKTSPNQKQQSYSLEIQKNEPRDPKNTKCSRNARVVILNLFKGWLCSCFYTHCVQLSDFFIKSGNASPQFEKSDLTMAGDLTIWYDGSFVIIKKYVTI